MINNLKDSLFIKKIEFSSGYIFLFKNKENKYFIVAWEPEKSLTLRLSPKVEKILDKNGEEISPSQKVIVDDSPKFIYFESKELPEKIIINE